MIKFPICIVLGVCLLANDAYSQDQKIVDSLNAVLADKKGGERFPALYELTFQYVASDKERALLLIQDAEKAALMSEDSLWIAKSKRVKGEILYILEQPEAARNTFFEALPIAVKKDLKREQLLMEFTLGKLDLFHGKYDNALELYFKTLEHAKRIKDTEHISLALHSIGITYYKLKDYSKGLAYLKRALGAHKFDLKESYYMFTNIGLCYAQLGDYVSAKYYVKKSLRNCGSDCSERNRINIEYAFGVIAQGERDYRAAEKHFLSSYSLARRVNNGRFQLDNIYLLSEIYIQQKQFHKAKTHLLQAERLINTKIPFNLEMIKIYYRFSELYFELREYRAASLYQSKYIHLKDSIYNEDLTNSLMKIEAEHLEHQNRAKIEAQEQVILLNEEIIRRQSTLNITAGLLGFVILAFLLFILRNYRRKQNANLLLEKKIKERTIELEISRDALQKAMHERDLRARRAAIGISTAFSTISGLCTAANLEVSDPKGRLYMNKIAHTFRQMTAYFQSALAEEIAMPPGE